MAAGRSVGVPTPTRRPGPPHEPGASTLEVEAGDDLHQSAGCSASGHRGAPSLTGQEPTVERHRQAARIEQGVVEALQREGITEAALLIGA